jgi:hypothetical protein
MLRIVKLLRSEVCFASVLANFTSLGEAILHYAAGIASLGEAILH